MNNNFFAAVLFVMLVTILGGAGYGLYKVMHDSGKVCIPCK